MTKTNFLGFIILSCLIVFAFTQSYENSVTDVNNNVSIIHHDCNCTSALGGSVSSTCRDACDCTCVSGFFTCSCACRCPNDHRTDVDVEKTFDP